MKKIVLIFCSLFFLFSFRKDKERKFLKASKLEKITSNYEEKSQNQGAIEEAIVNFSNSQGSVVADLSVGASGAVNYSIPVTVAPGLNGVNPEISIDFNSQSGNGMAGWGWNVSGISVITRIPSTQFHDNKLNPVSFDLDDRYALDGQRLIIKSGAYGVAGSVYQTEQYSNIKIVAYGSNPDQVDQTSGPSKVIEGPEYFKVFYPDGSIAHYGSTTNSRAPLDYAITYWENPQGVRISYEYHKYNDPYNLSIKQIDYGSIGEDSPINSIFFSYEDRERAEVALVGGVAFEQDKRLSAISVKQNNSPYRFYDLEYNKTALEYDCLESVKVSPENSSLTREVSFDYGNMGFQPQIERGEASQLSLADIEQRNAEVLTFDYTGNGQSDMIVYPTYGVDARKKFWLFENVLSPNGFSYLPNEINTGSFETILPVNWLNYENKLMPSQALAVIQNSENNKVDFNIMREGPATAGGFPVTDYTKSWNAPMSYSPDGGQYRIPQEYISGDFNGDGLSDVIALSQELTILFEYGWEFRELTLNDTPTASLIQLDRRLTNNFSIDLGALNGSASDNDKFFAMEMNGDGKTDLVRFRNGGKVEVYSLNETNTAIELIWERTHTSINNFLHIYPGDYNGDGLGDFMLPQANDSYDFITLLSTGAGFGLAFSTKPFKYINTDYDGQDGVGTLYGYNLLPVDINGDSKTDIISYDTETYNNSTNGTQKIKVYNNLGGDNEYNIASVKFELVSGSTKSYTGYLKHFPIPIFVAPETPNNTLAFASISDKWVSSFTFSANHKEDVTLKSVVNNGITTAIKYDRVDVNYSDNDDFDFFKSYSALSGGTTDIFPYVNVNVAPAFKVVRELEQTASGITRKRQFYYEGAVSHVNGLGFMGFKTVKSSSWFGNNAPPIWTISKYDPLFRGAQTERIISNSSSSNPNDYQSKISYFYDYDLIANPGSSVAPQYPQSLSRSAIISGQQTDQAEESITLLPGFHAIGSNGGYSASIFPPSEQPGATGYAGVANIRLNRIETDNGKTGVATTETYTYDTYNNPLTTTTTYPGGSRTVINTYSNNTNAVNNTYHVGKLLKMKESLTLSGSSFSTEEEYSYNNNQVTQIRRKGNGTDWITQDMEYDNYGNIKKKTLTANGVDPRIEEFDYDATYGHRFLTTSIGIDGLETTFSYNPISGSLVSSTDAFGLTTDYGHDIWDRITTETDYLSNITHYITEYQSDGGTKTTVDYPQGSKEEHIYNAFGWELKSGVLSLNNQWSYTS